MIKILNDFLKLIFLNLFVTYTFSILLRQKVVLQ